MLSSNIQSYLAKLCALETWNTVSLGLWAELTTGLLWVNPPWSGCALQKSHSGLIRTGNLREQHLPHDSSSNCGHTIYHILGMWCGMVVPTVWCLGQWSTGEISSSPGWQTSLKKRNSAVVTIITVCVEEQVNIGEYQKFSVFLQLSWGSSICDDSQYLVSHCKTLKALVDI